MELDQLFGHEYDPTVGTHTVRLRILLESGEWESLATNGALSGAHPTPVMRHPSIV